MVLYRPVGHRELELIGQANFKAFPPRLPDQPIFYPVLNAGYAREIAEGWNTKRDTFAGYITRFNIDQNYSQKFQKEIVGKKTHEELWIPSNELEVFNKNIFGHIEVIAAYFGDGFVGSEPDKGFTLNPQNADEYLQRLLNTLEYNGGDFLASIILNYRSVFYNFAYWKQIGINNVEGQKKDLKSHLIPQIDDIWHRNHPGIRLPGETQLLDWEKKYLA